MLAALVIFLREGVEAEHDHCDDAGIPQPHRAAGPLP
jgi:hypothetical protein